MPHWDRGGPADRGEVPDHAAKPFKAQGRRRRLATSWDGGSGPQHADRRALRAP